MQLTIHDVDDIQIGEIVELRTSGPLACTFYSRHIIVYDDKGNHHRLIFMSEQKSKLEFDQ